MKRTKHLGVRMDAELHGKMVFIAEYEGRSLSGQVLYLLTKCVREFEREHGPITPEDLAAVQDDA